MTNLKVAREKINFLEMLEKIQSRATQEMIS